MNPNLERGLLLYQQSRYELAEAELRQALANEPDDTYTHALLALCLAEREQFKEATAEALKARNIIYAVMLKYFLWMSRLTPGVQWGIILGGYFGNRLLSKLANSNPELAPWVLPLRIAYVAFALMTWIADPLFNLLLRLNRFGRLALSYEQTAASNWFGSSLLLALLALVGCMWYGFDGPRLTALLVFGILPLPLAGTFKCQSGWPRKAMAVYTGVMAAAGVTTVALHFIPEATSVLRLTRVGVLGLFVLGAIGSAWVANFLMALRPRR